MQSFRQRCLLWEVIRLTNEDIVKAIAENEQRARSNSHRITALEQNAKLLNKMVTALEVLAAQQRNVADHVEKIDSKVTRLEQAPIKRVWSVLGYILAALCSSAATVIFGNFQY